jgi:membrane-associated phospholipid phosphatase
VAAHVDLESVRRAAYVDAVRSGWVLLCLLASHPALAVEIPMAATQPRERPRWASPYALRLDLDLGLLLGGAALWAGTSFVASSAPGSWCGTQATPACDANSVNALDHTAIGFYSPGAGLAANVLVGVVPGALVLYSIFLDTGVTHWRDWLADAVVVTEAVLWAGAIQDITRRAVRRPRPFMYTPGLNPDGREGPEASFSFFSGHTSNLFAMVTAAAYTYTLRHPGSRWQWLVWSLGLGAASVEPLLRVLSGDHFPSDVIVGAVVGTAAGMLFPAIHRRKLPVAVTATSARDGGTVGLVGRF